MHESEEKGIKISRGSYKQLKWLVKVLEGDDEFDNKKIMNEIIINEAFTTIRRLKPSERRDALLALASDNYASIKRKGFTKNTRALGSVG